MSEPILQSRLPVLPWTDPALWRLPGVRPLDPASWLEVDDAFAPQMAEKARLIGLNPQKVHALPEAARPAAEELLARVLEHLARVPGYRIGAAEVLRPDGAVIGLDRLAPLLTLGALVQEDFCLLQQDGPEHRLSAALLTFPGSWMLSEKLGQPLTAIHAPVQPYDVALAQRVQRLFDAIRPEQPLWRMNALLYADAALYQPKLQTDRRPRTGARPYLRAEKQTLLRLPQSRAVVFSIHTYVIRAESLTAQDRLTLATHAAGSGVGSGTGGWGWVRVRDWGWGHTPVITLTA